jgi:CHAD domain-containing protein
LRDRFSSGIVNGISYMDMGAKPDRTEALVRKLERLLQEIPKKATADRVHHLRTTVRRIETIHSAFTQPPAGASKYWKRLSKIRRRAGKVRDLDVQMLALGTLKLESGQRDKLRLMHALEENRARQSKKLVKVVEELPRRELQKSLQRLQLSTAAIPAKQRRDQEAQWAAEALNHFFHAYEAHQPLDENNLHGFRMECKRARYRAEMASSYPQAKSLVNQLKSIQDTAGDWHDWLTLTQAGEKLLQNGNASPLLTLLQAQTHARFLRALQTVEEVRQALVAMKTSVPRMPPSSVPQAKSAVA